MLLLSTTALAAHLTGLDCAELALCRDGRIVVVVDTADTADKPAAESPKACGCATGPAPAMALLGLYSFFLLRRERRS